MSRLKQTQHGLIPYTPEEEARADAALEQFLSEAPLRLRAEKKIARSERVSALKVTSSFGNIFDANEISQDRIIRAIVDLMFYPAVAIPWILADNTTAQVTAAELQEVLHLARVAQTEAWIL